MEHPAPTDTPSITDITLATFATLLAQYPNHAPPSLSELEHARLATIPAAVAVREPQYVTKDELATLMDWKLAHGKFRPQLQKLIGKNEPVTVKSVTIEAFRLPLATPEEVKKALSTLSTLSGVGPATASLILSVKDAQEMPFFSDELYRWACWDDKSGWAKEIKYSEKSYLEMFPVVQALRERLRSEGAGEVSALDVEKVAYVLGRRALGPVQEKAKGKAKKRKATEAEVYEAAGAASQAAGATKTKAKSAHAPPSAGKGTGKKRKVAEVEGQG